MNVLNLNIDKKTKTIKRENISNTYRVIYKNGSFFVKIDNIEYLIYILQDYICEVNYIYSKPENDYHNTWTIKPSTKNRNRLDISNRWWSCIKDGQRIKGSVEEDGFFHLDLKYVNEVNEKNYNKSIKK